jgi:phosphate/sulfate permease
MWCSPNVLLGLRDSAGYDPLPLCGEGFDMVDIVLVVIITAWVFDFTNGFHDTANAMATSIATGALKPRVAVAVSGALNLVGAFLSVAVAKTISSGLVDDTKITPVVIFGGLIGAIVWNLLTWLVGLPSSSSHALFGGLIGATWVAAGGDAVHFGTVVSKVLAPRCWRRSSPAWWRWSAPTSPTGSPREPTVARC